ncbi:hypothetical protein F383_29710 [Gossypium arboreum]|uniref:Uncharacterized protein n=1 Tax=Gossypium arboreum TaxID=29729 RepID=A0A0B0MR92_GOSAR|nr:hypothetical protein F383_29710 [Gossypium arboreum]
MGIQTKETWSCPNPCTCLCNTLNWVTRPRHTPVC